MRAPTLKFVLLTALLAFLGGMDSFKLAKAAGISVSDEPLFSTTSQPPLMMIVMSRDEQLFNKAYTDYTDLDEDGLLDTSYQDKFNYSGYFDPKLCYAYSSNVFAVSDVATGTNTHECSSAWSGNFLNWVAMSRMDVLRFVMYGGARSTDTTSSTVLQRSHIPNDLHAWAKVYNGTDVAKFTPFASAPVTFCNASFGNAATDLPKMRVAQGNYSEWAATALSQCKWREDVFTGTPAGTCVDVNGTAASGDSSCWDDAPNTNALGDKEYNVQVNVCGSSTASKRESFCRKYTDAASKNYYKPAGLLQEYGESGKMRFGLMTGSFSAPRSGGVLRRNIGKIAGNATATDNEIDLNNGNFLNQASGDGIIRSMSALKLTQWDGGKWTDCNTYSILNRQNFAYGNGNLDNPGTSGKDANGDSSQACNSWGNPMSEMYAEALRYISGEKSPTSTFTAGTDLTGLPSATWADPYRSPNSGGNYYCANCSILALSTGLNSFDSDEIPTVTSLGATAESATTTVGTLEGISGDYLVGRVQDLPIRTSIDTHTDLCTAKTVSALGLVRGICPDVPSMEGSYEIAGLAYKAWTTDLRPTLVTPSGDPKPSTFKNVVKTFSVALAESLPKFQIPLGDKKITLAPLCQASNNGAHDGLGGANDTEWRSCFLGSVSVGSKVSNLSSSYVYGRPLEADTSAGSFSLVWEDSLWGSDHDNDVVSMITYCVGAKCQKSSNLPSATTDKLCAYTAINYGGSEFCFGATQSGNFTSTYDKKVRSIKVPSYGSYTLRLCTGTNQTGTCANYTANSADLNPNRDVYRSWIITGTLPVPASAYAGYDICWRATTTGSDASADCPANGKPTVASDEVLIRIENLSAYAGNAMLTGYAINGSNADGLKRLTLRPGNANGSVITQSLEPRSEWYKPIIVKYKIGTSTAKQLENPLFYAAKYGGYKDKNGNGKPDSGEWDTNVAGTPDNFFAVRNPAKLKTELQKVFDQVLADAEPAAGIATSAPRFVPGADNLLAYQVTFKADDWSGDVQAFNLNPNGTLGTQVWSANDKIPLVPVRKVFTAQPNASGKLVGTAFSSSGLNTLTKASVFGSLDPLLYNVDDEISYLLGDRSKEQPVGVYRKRGGKIGDILTSTPAVVRQRSFGYSNLPATVNGVATGNTDYLTFVNAKSTDSILFVGANDGMMHGINGTVTGGNELFGYVPNAVLNKLYRLAQPAYSHTYYADSSPYVGDAYVGGGWKEVLLSAAGAGARAVYALDVTKPTAFAATNVLWEFNSGIDSDMGQLMEKPQLVLMKDGKWSAVFGNGFNGASNKAVLFIRNAADGSSIAKLDTGVGTALDPNGMTGVAAVDTDLDRVADVVYAGDYQGNLWKFWYKGGVWVNAVASGKPLFTAKDKYGHRQPITGGLDVVTNPLGGMVVLFGTGKYLTPDDATPGLAESDGKPLVNSLYGIWDKTGGDSTTTEVTTVARTSLKQQEITNYNTDSSTGRKGDRTSTRRPVSYGGSDMGWYLDLTYVTAGKETLPSERVIAAPAVVLGTVLFNSFRPLGDSCAPGGLNALTELDALSGAANFTETNPGSGTYTPPAGNTGGTDVGTGPPQGEPNPVISMGSPPVLPPINCTPGDPGCSYTYTPPVSADQCMWVYPNTANKAISSPIPCGRVAWRQVR